MKREYFGLKTIWILVGLLVAAVIAWEWWQAHKTGSGPSLMPGQNPAVAQIGPAAQPGATPTTLTNGVYN